MIGAEPVAPKYFGYLLQLDSSLEKTDARKDWGQEGGRGWQDEMVGWHYSLNGHEFEQTPADSEGQGSLACCSSWDCRQTWLSYWTTTNYQ